MYTPYNAMYQPYMPTTPPSVAQFQPLAPRMDITKVSGRNGAEAYQMGINSSVLLLDETAPIVWLKTTDGAGYPTITPYTITPYKEANDQDTLKADFSALETRISKLEEIINEQSNIRNDEHSKGNATSEPNEATPKRSAKS